MFIKKAVGSPTAFAQGMYDAVLPDLLSSEVEF
jgi:hypothetical protein